MLRPWKVSGVTERDYGWFGKEPLVQSATWRAQDGRNAVVLANFADLGESPRVELEGRGTKRLIMDLDGEKTERDVELPSALDVKMCFCLPLPNRIENIEELSAIALPLGIKLLEQGMRSLGGALGTPVSFTLSSRQRPETFSHFGCYVLLTLVFNPGILQELCHV